MPPEVPVENPEPKIEDFWAGEQHLPSVISLKLTDKIAEINMEHRGESLM